MTTPLSAAPAGPAAAGSRALRPSPVDAAIDVVSVERDDRVLNAVTTIAIAASEPVFAGHYPHFPIFPGVCVVECVQRSALAVAERCGLPEPRLLAVESTRFLGPVRPGDLLTVRLDLSDHEGAVRCRATASTGRGDAASVRLRLSGEVAA